MNRRQHSPIPYNKKLLWQERVQTKTKVCSCLSKIVHLAHTHPLFHWVESAQHNYNIDYDEGEASKQNCLIILQNLMQEVQVAATHHIIPYVKTLLHI